MKEKKDNIEEIFVSKLKSFEMDVPDSVWYQLSDRLPAGKLVASEEKHSKKKLLWWSLSAVASLLLLLVMLHQERTGDSPMNTLRDEAKNIARQTMGEAEATQNYAKNEPLVSFSKKNRRKSLTSGNISLTTSPQKMEHEMLPEDIGVSQESRAESVASEQANASDRKKDDPELERKTDEFSNAAKDVTDKLFADPDVKVATQKERQKIGLTAAGGLGLSSQTKTANQLLSLNDYSQSASALRSDNYMSTQGMTSSSNSTYKLDHSWPVSFGIGVTKPLTSFLNLEVGISYSYLYSKQRGESNATMRQSQQFSYIGLPVGLNFRVATWERLRLGILVGGSIQKDIAGRLKQEIEASSSYEDYSSSSIHQKHIQPSINANLHLSYSIGKNFSLFGKVGGAYYFDMNDTYNTIYSDKNFLPDVGFGLSYDIEY